jgi:hypothetical protein
MIMRSGERMEQGGEEMSEWPLLPSYSRTNEGRERKEQGGEEILE